MIAYSSNCLISQEWLASTAEGDSIINATLLYLLMLYVTDEELEELKTEFSHHQQKLEEFNQLKNEVDNIAANGEP